jgi:radical SAM protein (TIGR01212 family)
METGRERLRRRYKAAKYIAYFQAHTNTYAPPERLRALWDEALAGPDVVGLSVGTRPDCVPDPVLDLLEEYASRVMVWVEYGLQTANDTTLMALNRGHGAACFEDAVRRTLGRGILVCAHVILGLPGEGMEDALKTADLVAGTGCHGIKIHSLYVARGTALEQWLAEGRFRCQELSEYADQVCAVLERLPPGMVAQRLTGDPRPEELLAPAWTLDKARVLKEIARRLEERDTWQGKAWRGVGACAKKYYS